MTHPTVTLPIKCSTVRSAHFYLQRIITIELVVFLSLLVLTIQGVKFPDLYSQKAIVMYQACLLGVLVFGILLFVLWVVAIVFSYIEDHFPKLECIRDE